MSNIYAKSYQSSIISCVEVIATNEVIPLKMSRNDVGQ